MTRPSTPAEPHNSVDDRTTLAVLIARAFSDEAPVHERVGVWLAGLDSGDGRTLKALIDAEPAISRLLSRLAAGSPYLWHLATDDPSRLLRVLQDDPDVYLDRLLTEASEAARNAGDDAGVMHVLRQMKAEAALLIALSDIAGVWPVMQTTRALTRLADTAVDAAVRHLLADAANAGKLRPPNRRDVCEGSGYIVLAMGKMGAYELNYSSDIDLIVFYDRAAPALVPDIEPSTFFVRLTQRLVKIMQERTADGYVFRTDLRLRPDPGSTAVAVSTDAALSYYESTGRNWERAAMIKARVCAGDRVAGARVLADIAPFVWRKYLDYASVAEVHAMKRQIQAYRGHGEIAVEGHNVKLGRGGIREIEFFVQTQQLIAGGRHPDLRDRETLITLGKLAEGNWISREARDDLDAAYRYLRVVEHRLQMVNDEQTHTLPEEPEEVERLARLLGYETRSDFATELCRQLGAVQRHYGNLFEASASDAPPLSFPADTDDRKTLDRLVAMGFKAPLETSATVRQWLTGEYRPLRGDAARDELVALLPALLEQLGRTENSESALIAFDRFLSALHGGGRFLSLLRQNPELIELTALILAIAPRLAGILARYPQVMDSLVDPSFFGALPDDEQLGAQLGASVAQAVDHQDFLDRVRMFGLESMFLIGARILSGTVTAQQAGSAFARLADVVIRFIHKRTAENFKAQHGQLRGASMAVLALGKLGGLEMTATSDLDLIVMYDFDDAQPDSDGARPLSGGHYFARLTQRLINTLTAQTNYGALYQVDMRLRPSGRSGPLATSLAGFKSYQESEAWTWEHMALTRARVVSAPPEFAAQVETAIKDVLTRERDAESIAGDVVEMRGAIAKEKGEGDRWDLKYAAGGLIDIEFIAQYLQLIHAAALPDILDTSTVRVLDKALRHGVLPPEDAEILRPAVRLYLDLTQVLRLCLTEKFDPKTAGPGLQRLLVRAADVPDFPALDAHVAETQAQVRKSFVRILGASPT